MLKLTLPILLLVLSGCMNFYRDASRQAFEDIDDTAMALNMQLDAEKAACQTDACREDVERRRAQADELLSRARELDEKNQDARDQWVLDIYFAQTGRLRRAWESGAEGLLGDVREVQANAQNLLRLDRRLEDVGYGTAAAQDALSFGAETATDRLIAEREQVAQSLIYFKGELESSINRFVNGIRSTVNEMHPSVLQELRLRHQIDIEHTLDEFWSISFEIGAAPIQTGLGTSTQDELNIGYTRNSLLGEGGQYGLIPNLQQLDNSLVSVGQGLIAAENALAGEVSAAGNRYRELADILSVLEGMQQESVANCLAIQ